MLISRGKLIYKQNWHREDIQGPKGVILQEEVVGAALLHLSPLTSHKSVMVSPVCKIKDCTGKLFENTT